MGMLISVINDKQDIERKIRILNSLIRADKEKKDDRSLKYHTQALTTQQEALNKLCEQGVV